jgi:DNA-binding MltR family transcriptional regulator
MSASPTRAALKRLSRQKFDKNQVSEFLAEVSSGNDRSAALVWGALVEDALQSAIEKRLYHFNSDELNSLFGGNGFLENFAAKSLMAYAINIVTKEQYRDLDLIREIRNAFAHTMPNVTFETKEVMDVCDLLSTYYEYGFLATKNRRAIYSYACLRLWQRLVILKAHSQCQAMMVAFILCRAGATTTNPHHSAKRFSQDFTSGLG